MKTTKQLPRAEWKDYFDRFTQDHIGPDPSGSATVEVMSPTLGDHFEVSAVRLLGLSFDPKAQTLEVLLENVDHLIFQPKEIWVLEGELGFVATLEIVRMDGTKEIIYVRRSGPPAPRYKLPRPGVPAGGNDRRTSR